jgi:hypothetical protein
MIPGAYEPNTTTRRQPGAMTGAPNGSGDIPAGGTLLDAATRAAREMEGGGGVSQRPRKRNRGLEGRTDAGMDNQSRAARGSAWLLFWRFLHR